MTHTLEEQRKAAIWFAVRHGVYPKPGARTITCDGKEFIVISESALQGLVK